MARVYDIIFPDGSRGPVSDPRYIANLLAVGAKVARADGSIAFVSWNGPGPGTANDPDSITIDGVLLSTGQVLYVNGIPVQNVQPVQMSSQPVQAAPVQMSSQPAAPPVTVTIPASSRTPHGLPNQGNQLANFAGTASNALGRTVTTAEIQNALDSGFAVSQVTSGAYTTGEPPVFLPGTTTPNPFYVPFFDYSMPVPQMLPPARLQAAQATLAATGYLPGVPFVIGVGPVFPTTPTVSTVLVDSSSGSQPGIMGDPRTTATAEEAQPVTRFIMETAPGRVDTGANYPGCARDNQGACIPIQFSSMEDALQYAADHRENPVIVPDAETAWGMVEGTIPIPSAAGMSSTTMLGLGAAAVLGFLLWRRK